MQSGTVEKNGVILPDAERNCVFSNGKETTKHWLVKSIIFKILRDRGRQVRTEVNINGRSVDVLDVDNMIAYEVENRLNRRELASRMVSLSGLTDVFFVDVAEVPDDFAEADFYLRQRVV